ncbi:PREDICTED: small subunit processome component 20 homolog [Priapulus caudatus]|uniref:Small subunit processome component 20 homolog n=1 Tax=Priapulus caudatus TaxID=37621 RepID=A0ABM1EPF1_PRICU|nr:PREDICTED: small subunit processome component 20 homolog [Priapulus caudatus]
MAVVLAIAAGDGQASSLASVATRLNAWDRKRLDEPDYETRLSAFHEANRVVRDMEPVAMETECGTGFLLTVIHNCFFYISTSDDMSLRDSASHCLQQLIVHLASVKDNVTPRTMQILIDDNCLAQVKIGIKHKSESAKHEYVAVLAQLVRSFPEHAKLKYLLGLMDVDPEADFFENMRHIQIHRRGKALKKLQRYLQTSTIHPEAVMSLLLPLATTFLFHETYAQQQNIVDDAINTLGATCALLPWKHYEVLLRRYLSKLSKQPEYQKQSIKCIVVILDAFHFDLSLCEAVDYSTGRTLTDDDIGEAEDDTDFQQTDTADVAVETETDVAMETEKGGGSAGEGGGDSNEDVVGDVQEEVLAESSSSSSQANLAARIHKVMSRVILPPLHRALTQKVKSDGEHKLAKKVYTEDQEVLRVPIALAMVKLLQKLPKHSLHSNLPNVLLKLCELLRSRARDVRDATRDTIVRIVAALGPAYLHYLLREMRATLRRGYQRHVLTYTTHAVLRSMEEEAERRALRSSLSTY